MLSCQGMSLGLFSLVGGNMISNFLETKAALEKLVPEHLPDALLFVLEGDGRNPREYQKIIAFGKHTAARIERELHQLLCNPIAVDHLDRLFTQKYKTPMRFSYKPRLGCRIEPR